jgi:serine/threonine protein kinase
VPDASFAQGLIGVTLDGRYRLDAVLGEGGMGSVFRATQLALERKVAVKLLKPHLTSDRAALERFSREARATLKVESPHAVKLLDFGVTPLGDYYMVLEYLDGRTVQRELEIDGPFAPARVAHIARQALHALGVAHAQGLIHRDVKPDNLLLMRVGADADYTKILDFGVAKLMQGTAGDPARLALTADGMVFGTPEFMSPEQACGQSLDGRSDLYSLAATMFVMLTGTMLFEGRSPIEWLTHHARTPPPPLAMVSPDLAAYPGLDDLLQRCLAKQPGDRPETAQDMARELAALAPALQHGPTRPRTPSKPTVVHASSYFEALRDASGATAVGPAPTAASAVDLAAGPAAGPVAVPDPSSTATTGLRAMTRRRRRYQWLGGITAAALIGGAAGLALHHRSPGAVPPAPHVVADVPAPADAGTTPMVAPHDAGPAAHDAGAPTEVPPGPVGPSRVMPVVRPTRPIAPVRNPEAEEHLRAAEAVYRSDGSPLTQVQEADAALRADPRSVRARFLLGDALLKSGDVDRGCKYLAQIKRYAAARARARAASCPDD